MRFTTLLTCMLLTLSACTSSSRDNKEHSEEELKKLTIRELTVMMEKWTFHNTPSVWDDNAETYYTTDLLETLKEAQEASGDEMFMDFEPWSESQDPDPKTRGEVTDVYDITDSTATVELTITWWKTPLKKTAHLLYTDNGWRIDDFTINQEGQTLRERLK